MDAVATVWRRSRQVLLERVELLEAATAALEENALPPQVRARAYDAAHKLAGALGCFGLHEGTAIARDLEQRLEPGMDLQLAEASILSGKVATLRLAIESAPAELSEGTSELGPGS